MQQKADECQYRRDSEVRLLGMGCINLERVVPSRANND